MPGRGSKRPTRRLPVRPGPQAGPAGGRAPTRVAAAPVARKGRRRSRGEHGTASTYKHDRHRSGPRRRRQLLCRHGPCRTPVIDANGCARGEAGVPTAVGSKPRCCVGPPAPGGWEPSATTATAASPAAADPPSGCCPPTGGSGNMTSADSRTRRCCVTPATKRTASASTTSSPATIPPTWPTCAPAAVKAALAPRPRRHPRPRRPGPRHPRRPPSRWGPAPPRRGDVRRRPEPQPAHPVPVGTVVTCASIGV